MTDLKDDKAKDGENKDEEEGQDASAGSKVASMKDGSYLLHVLIETGKNLKLDGEDTINPMVKVSFLG